MAACSGEQGEELTSQLKFDVSTCRRCTAVGRGPRALAAALVALFLYSGIVIGLVPQPGVSWEGHLFGLVAGDAARFFGVSYTR